MVDVANPATVDALLEHAPHLVVQGFSSGLFGGHSHDEVKSAGVLRHKNSTVYTSLLVTLRAVSKLIGISILETSVFSSIFKTAVA